MTSYHQTTIEVTDKGGAAYGSFEIPQAMYKYLSDDLGNMRIYTEGGAEEVPYFVRSYTYTADTTQVEVVMNCAQIFEKEGVQYYDYAVWQENAYEDVPLTALEVILAGQDQLSKVTVQGSYDGDKWCDVTEGLLYTIEGVGEETCLMLPDKQEYLYYRFGVEDGRIKHVQGVYQEASYMVNQKKQPLEPTYTVAVNETNDTVITLDNNDYVNVADLEVTLQGTYHRPYTIALYNQEEQLVTKERGELIGIDFENQRILRNEVLQDNTVRFDKAVLTIYNGSDQPLEVATMQMNYYTDRVFFKLSGDTYQWVFGPLDMVAPVYDIAHYQEAVVQQATDAIQLHTEVAFIDDAEETTTSGHSLDYGVIYLVVLVSIALVLIKYILLPNLKDK